MAPSLRQFSPAAAPLGEFHRGDKMRGAKGGEMSKTNATKPKGGQAWVLKNGLVNVGVYLPTATKKKLLALVRAEGHRSISAYFVAHIEGAHASLKGR